jgi:hypothetical protein
MKTFEAQSLQLALTAYCLDRPVLNIWSYFRRPRVLYPAAGLPYWSGIRTRWNTRPCLAALTPVINNPPYGLAHDVEVLVDFRNEILI